MEKMTITKWKDLGIKILSNSLVGLMVAILTLTLTARMNGKDDIKNKLDSLEVNKLDRTTFTAHESKQDIQIRQIKEDRKQDLDQIEKLFNSRFDDFQKWYIKNNK